MKKLVLPILIISSLLIGCLETTEGLLINKDGSGSYAMEMDMNGMFAFMDMMKTVDSSAGSGIPEDRKNFDSTILFKSFVDTATDLTAEEKTLLRNAAAYIKVNEKEKVFKIKMTYPFAKIDDVAKLVALNGAGKGSNRIQQIFKGKTGNQDTTSVNPGLPDYSDMYQMTYKNGLLERKLIPEKFKEFGAQFSGGGMDEMTSSVKMNTTIQLPGKAKSVQGEKVKLSDDKKTVTINCTLKDLLANPKALEYRIEY